MLEKLEEGIKDNVHRKVDVVDTNFLQSYIPDDSHYNEATNLAAYMGEQDVDIFYSMLECNQALRDGNQRPRLRPRLRWKINLALRATDKSTVMG